MSKKQYKPYILHIMKWLEAHNTEPQAGERALIVAIISTAMQDNDEDFLYSDTFISYCRMLGLSVYYQRLLYYKHFHGRTRDSIKKVLKDVTLYGDSTEKLDTYTIELDEETQIKKRKENEF